MRPPTAGGVISLHERDHPEDALRGAAGRGRRAASSRARRREGDPVDAVPLAPDARRRAQPNPSRAGPDTCHAESIMCAAVHEPGGDGRRPLPDGSARSRPKTRSVAWATSRSAACRATAEAAAQRPGTEDPGHREPRISRAGRRRRLRRDSDDALRRGRTNPAADHAVAQRA